MDELPARALDWAARAARTPIAHVRPIGGGLTRTKWLLILTDDSSLVLRWEDLREWGAVGREHVRREALAARLLHGSGLPVPRLLAVDLDGTDAGGSANLMTWLPGRTRHDRVDPAAMTALARSAVAIHRRPVPAPERPPAFSLRGAASRPIVPEWARRPTAWRRAFSIVAGDPPPTSPGLLHRDLHFGNVLWQGNAVSGLVDWAETSWGPPDLDVAHLCSDFAMLHTVAEAEEFRALYRREGGRLDPDPDAARFWMIGDIVGFLPDPAHILPGISAARPDLTPERVRRGLEELLEAVLAW